MNGSLHGALDHGMFSIDPPRSGLRCVNAQAYVGWVPNIGRFGAGP
jgi:hypothetical protein